ncbi:redoxin family protein [Pedobacter suwonensis]|uniref:TlpA family protein disulfide reductase n=1 Tax=Pedobacter suwonensis TaxID=332999 RepID=UPI003CFFFABC
MKNIIILILLVLLNKLTFGQNSGIQRIKIGDTLPDTKIHYSLNGIPKTIDTRTLRGKIIILDFWNIWCGTCIDLMPEMERLNTKYKNDIQIFLVTNNNQKQIDDQFNKINARSMDHDVSRGRNVTRGAYAGGRTPRKHGCTTLLQRAGAREQDFRAQWFGPGAPAPDRASRPFRTTSRRTPPGAGTLPSRARRLSPRGAAARLLPSSGLLRPPPATGKDGAPRT